MKKHIALAIALLFTLVISIYFLSRGHRDIENFSEDYEGAIRYHLTASNLDLKAVNTYPQKIEKINSEAPYDIVLLVKNQPYFTTDPVPYDKYQYDEPIAQYLEPTETIQTDTELVTKTAESFLSEDATIIGIVSKALQWNKNNIRYDKPLSRLISVDITKTRSAEETIKLKAGACSEYANVFVAFMRHLGIPARYVFGYHQVPDPTYHAWAEFYLKGYGWIPVETQTGKLGVPDFLIKLYVGKDLEDIGVQIYKMNAHYEVIE